MDNFYLVEITAFMDESPTAQAIWEKPDIDTALMDFHGSMASAMANENTAFATRVIVDYAGAEVRREYWSRPTEPSPEPTPDPNIENK